MLSHANVSVQSNQSPPTYKFFIHFYYTSAKYSGMEILHFFFLSLNAAAIYGIALFRIIVNEWAIFTLEFIVNVKGNSVNQIRLCGTRIFQHMNGVAAENSPSNQPSIFDVYALKCALSKLTSLDIKDTIINLN